MRNHALLRAGAIGTLRMQQQGLVEPRFSSPAEVVRWFGAVQAQEYQPSLWAIGLRMRGAVEQEVEESVRTGAIVRFWPMRGTIHFAAAEDVRWLLALLAPRAMARQAGSLKRHHGLDEGVYRRCRPILQRALKSEAALTRPQIYALFEKARIATKQGRGLRILWQLAHEGLICFGPRKGKQATFVLLDDWVSSPRNPPSREQSLSELARRYFRSHGPAKLADFLWWSGLTAREGREALHLARSALRREVAEGKEYWLDAAIDVPSPSRIMRLLPWYDEYCVAYRDRTAVLDSKYARQVNAGGGILQPVMVRRGRVVGTWMRQNVGEQILLRANWFEPAGRSDHRRLREAARHYGDFLQREVGVIVNDGHRR